jgi:murein DD-endopeptidase MepM/ murein hydrolase activator NlpD
MKSKLFLIFGILFFTLSSYAQKQNQDFLNYIEKYADLAIQEMERAGIPASIKLAQGLLESSAGKSYLARKGNNHFGIKCGNNWDGKKVYKEDDDFDDRGKLIKSCFRSYRNVRASYIAHSEFLRDPRKVHRYGFLFRLDHTDYRRWARGLKQAGYATSATYDKKLIKLIETYELYKFDTASPVDVIDQPDLIVDTDSGSSSSIQQSVNDVKYFIAQDGELVSDLARRADISVKRLVKYNEQIDGGSEALKKGIRVFVQPKRNKYRGKKLEHKVEAGETMFFISQMYAVKLSKLYFCNRMEEGTEPAVGELIRLKGKAKERPRLQGESVEDREELDMIDEDEEITTDPRTEDREETRPPVTKPTDRSEIPQPRPEEETKPEFDEELEFEEIIEEEEEEFVPPLEDEELEEEVIEIPPREEPLPPPPPPVIEPEEKEVEEEAPVVTPAVDPQFYTVQRGDTLWAISRKFNTTVEAIRRMNNIEGNYIRRGMRLRVK